MQVLHPAIVYRRDPFVSASAMLFGAEWQHAAARALGQFHPNGPREAIDARLIRRWAAGERVVPNWVISALAAMTNLRERELSGMRVRLSSVDAALASEVADFSVTVKSQQICATHGPSADEFAFVLLTDSNQTGGGYTYVPGPLRPDADSPEVDVLAESARQAARQFLNCHPAR
jgi:hypothetical protein